MSNMTDNNTMTQVPSLLDAVTDNNRLTPPSLLQLINITVACLATLLLIK